MKKGGGVRARHSVSYFPGAHHFLCGFDFCPQFLHYVATPLVPRFGVDGKQYVAVITGAGSPLTGTFPVLVPEIQNPPDRESTVWVFELPGK